ncbi:reverse transcriptase domain-containing protein [Tanacetum coccineum]|uniref:Reverse transcriptase domain-containing protein n=1 Tax=Tanacetum coccineum TaxID=301880 RepID=A0ABQ5B500_9ASTR
MEEMLHKFIDEGKREHEEMRAFISEFRTTNELLFKERNISLSELRFEVHELLRVIDNTPISNCEVKGVTTRGGKMMTQDIQNNNTNIHTEEPLVVNHAKPVESTKVLSGNQPQKTNEPVVQLSIQITLRVGYDEVIFDVDQSIKRPPAEDDECYGIDELDDTINTETQELLANDKSDSFLLKGLEKSINQSDLERCESLGNKSDDDSDLEKPIRHIDYVNTPYSVTQETARPDEVESEHLYSTSANEIDEKKPELKNLPHHLEYAYLHGDKSFPIIISSKLSKKEKMLLLQVLEKCKGAIAWKMLDTKGISPSFCTHKILMEDDFKPVIQPQRHSSWVSPIHVVPKKGGMTVVLNDNNELIPSHTVTGWRVCIDYRKLNDATRKDHFPLPFIDQIMPFGLCNAPATFQRCMTAIFHDMVEDFMEVFMDDFSVFGNSFNCCLANLDRMLAICEETNLVLNWEKWAENLAADHLSRLENPNLGAFTVEEIADEFPDEHLMILKAKLNDDEPWLCVDNVMRRCVAGNEILEILAHCHSGPTRDHHSASITGRKVYELGFFWPSIFKDAKDYVMRCDACQRLGNISSRMAVDYVSNWVEAQALPTNDACVAIKFLRWLCARFGVPKALISDRGTHFCNFQLEKALQKYGVTHKLSTTYHPQTNRQTKVTNRAIKRILERSVGYNPKDWSEKLNGALWAFRTAYKTPMGCTPFRLVYEKACHLPVEIEHKAYWALKQCNMDLTATTKNRFIELNELMELRDGAYENTQICKERTKKWHDSRLRGDKDFKVREKV